MTSTPQPRSRFVDIDGSRRHLVEWGEPGAPTVLLQHGMRDHARSWDWFASRLARDHHVVVPDLRGHGDSDWSAEGAYGLSDYVFDLAEIVASLGLAGFDLVGHSLGAHISLRYAGTFPEMLRSLTIIEGIELPIVRDQLAAPKPYPQRLRQWVENRRKARGRLIRYFATTAEAEARMAEENEGFDAALIAELTRHGIIGEAGKGLRWKFDHACRLRPPEDSHGIDLDDVLDAITCPVLLAYGEDSWIPVPSAARLNRLRRHHLVTYPGASHWLHHQAREPFFADLTTFLNAPEQGPLQKVTKHA
ncbi:alpha/beta fold hydrolase [Novosphingobium colocasiae]|uniref:Hydrolase n=1 Tax=Novosphingobium colocasiae TaxID=1256513 RepID=A0A918PB88_9SPHN|nr:alpha/beta hydrolase [Novosphingobium colocasiae]GGY95701.1 hydrolase [Novosphingobium colocasiae]